MTVKYIRVYYVGKRKFKKELFKLGDFKLGRWFRSILAYETTIIIDINKKADNENDKHLMHQLGVIIGEKPTFWTLSWMNKLSFLRLFKPRFWEDYQIDFSMTVEHRDIQLEEVYKAGSVSVKKIASE